MAISTQLVASLAAGGTSITAVTTPSLSSGLTYKETYTWGESGKTYLVMESRGLGISVSSSGGVGINGNNGNPMHVVSGPIIFSDSSRTFLCIEVATN